MEVNSRYYKMNSIFKVTWDGDVPGLAEHRLSVDSFGEAIGLLLKAYRRIASNMLRDAIDQKLADKRLNKHAKWLDLQIESITEGSSGFAAVGVLHAPRGQTSVLFEDLSTRAGVELLTAIEEESNGRLRSKAVRKFLAALPPGVTRQEYAFQSNGTSKTVTLGGLELAIEPRDVPHLLEFDGFVVSVGFEPGSPFVRIDTGDARPVQCQATTEQVEAALAMRETKINALVVRNRNRTRLLRIQPIEDQAQPLSGDEYEEVVFTKWDSLLHRLAQ